VGTTSTVNGAGAVQEAGLFGWFTSASADARRALLAASLGWMLDAFDVMLYSLVLASILTDFGMSKVTGGVLGSLTLAASAFGGIVFGMIADRWGRRAAMSGSILMYSVFTGACGLVANVWQLAVCRFLLGLGMGGEWTSGAALVAETWPARHRGKAMGLMQSAWAVGYALAALVTAIVLPRFGWRAAFYVGVLPALLILWVRRYVKESDVWTASRVHQHSSPLASLAAIFGPDVRQFTASVTLLSLFTLFAYWGLNFWIPAYLSLPESQGGIGLSTGDTTYLVVTMQAGTWLGYVSFGFISDAIGRKRAFVIYLLCAAVLVAAYASTRNATLLLALGPVAAFFGTGYFSGFGAITAELFPTKMRATAQGFTFNVGRLGSAAAPFVVASIAQGYGFGVAFGLTSLAFLLAASVWIWIPETAGTDLR
jgi:MFS family permease